MNMRFNMMDFSYDGIITKQRYDTNISSKHTIHNIYIYTIYIFQRQLDPFGLLFNRHPQFDPMAPLVATATRPRARGRHGSDSVTFLAAVVAAVAAVAFRGVCERF